ncbi:MAG TPA: hypothetical protein DD727_01970 [Clostridiales bacterium]|nr:hypothetical protein [Clostridiales bacterium]
MTRKTFAVRIKPGRKDEFKKRFGDVPASLIQALDRLGARNFSVWSVENLAFGYLEMPDATAGETAGGTAGETAGMENDFFDRLQEFLRDCCDFIGLPGTMSMRLMYEDIGMIREDKSKIRHRVFVTRLKPGTAEEYKRRHDELVASRDGKVNPGPESNFTIWNATDYIFGYCELDRAMEHEPTEEEKKATVAWETRGLEIMDWVTDDVDWLTGLKHEKIQKLFAYK